MTRRWKPLLLLLPLVILAGLIARNELALANATEWRIPITGYDPRDPLRGRYIQFQYDWQVDLAAQPTGVGQAVTELCILSSPPRMDRVSVSIGAEVRDCEHVIRNLDGYVSARGANPIFNSRIFVDERDARRLENDLRQKDMVVVAKLTKAGRLVNQRLEPAIPEETDR